MNRRLILACWICCHLAVGGSEGLTPRLLAAQDPFAANIRPTDPLSPKDEQASFRLPPGFEIQLVASEPQILKPMNMAFDDRGRLWITESTEYPFPVTTDRKGRDHVKILQDTDGDGRADKITTFADGLNIPIGLYPYKDGVIAFSIPYIWRCRDTDGDGVADQRTKLFGPFGFERDAHGLNNAFRRGFDGWVYACHGFNNVTTVAGTDGHRIHMQSGNTYRFRLDGSRIEHFTWGQVNPFGMTMDPLGDLFTADCHSKPITQLLRGGYYPSFGKPHDGLGFVPPMMDHMHGSTAIAGVACYLASQFPEEYRGNMFSGNVMTSRVNRNALEYHGSTILAREMPDFLSTTDPWFRPVDLQVGPDGALYIADFYNRIIGHYEVPLDHPGRDRFRGRIWRVVYTGAPVPAGAPALSTRPSRSASDGSPTPPPSPSGDQPSVGARERGQGAESAGSPPTDLSGASVRELIAALDHDNFTVRCLAMNRLVDVYGSSSEPPGSSRRCVAEDVTTAFQQSKSGRLRSHALWVLYRLGALPETILLEAAQDHDRRVRVHAMKVLAETSRWSQTLHDLVLVGLTDRDAFVRRAAADALGRHPHADNIQPLLDLLATVPAEDTHLRHTARMALRDQLALPERFAALQQAPLNEKEARTVAGVCLALRSTQAASFLVQHVRQYSVAQSRLTEFLQHAARYVPEKDADVLARLVQERFANDVDTQWTLFDAILRGFRERGASNPQSLEAWGAELASQLLDSVDPQSRGWINTPIPAAKRTGSPWVLQTRRSSDGDTTAQFLSSLPRGEQLTGVLRSPEFEIPAKLQFYMAGHNGPPGKPVIPKNVIRLREATLVKPPSSTSPQRANKPEASATGPRPSRSVSDGSILAEALPPRNDVAQPVDWDLTRYAGRRGYLEVVDRNDGSGYAWLAVGRFSPAVVRLPKLSPAQVVERQQAAARIAAELKLRSLKSRLASLLTSNGTDPAVREAAGRALLAMHPDSRLEALVPLLGDPDTSADLRDNVSRVIARPDMSSVQKTLTEAVSTLPRQMQERLATSLARDKTGAEVLLKLIETGHASGRLLMRAGIREQLLALSLDGIEDRIQKLTQNLPPPNEQTRTLIDAVRQAYLQADASPQRGAEVFARHCSACHQVHGEGRLVGPQLDGIGNRGLDRLVEDVLDPNRNVDVAFRTTLLVMKDGRVRTGLLRQDDGAILVLVDQKGEEFRVPKQDVETRKQSNLSLMPENVAELTSRAELFDLIAFLLSQTEKKPSPAQ